MEKRWKRDGKLERKKDIKPCGKSKKNQKKYQVLFGQYEREKKKVNDSFLRCQCFLGWL